MDVAKYFGLKYAKKSEPRIEDHFPTVFASPDHVLWIMMSYFLFIIIGQGMMFKRKPLRLSFIMPFYNVCQVIANLYLALWIVRLMMYYYFNKITDLMDTVFLVLRKKRSQVTFLHLFHHSTMVVSSWLSIAYYRENMCLIFGLINMVVHFFMYTYYFLSSFGPKMQKFLFWKKLLTIMQLVQFVAMVALLLKMKIYNCNYDVVFWRIWIFNVIAFTGLFWNFYKKTYKKKRK